VVRGRCARLGRRLLASLGSRGQRVEREAVGAFPPDYLFTDAYGEQVHPHAISQTFERIALLAEVPLIRLHDLRHTHATLLIKAGVPVKVVSERLGHARAAFTIETYQHVLRGMQAEARARSRNSWPTSLR
jgi:integrase